MPRLPNKQSPMATQLALEPALPDRAAEVGCEPTETAIVTLALKGFVARRGHRGVVELFGKLEWDHACSYKEERSRPCPLLVDT
jgi:hypothetical protein